MRYVLPTAILALILTACSGETPQGSEGGVTPDPIVSAPSEITEAPAAADGADGIFAPSAAPSEMVEEGAVVLTVDRLVSEPQACLVIMTVVNGLDEAANAGIFAFDVTGNGETAGANMFPQTAEPGEMKTSQIILPGSDCENVQKIEGGQINCTLPETGESCLGELELRDGIVDFSAND